MTRAADRALLADWKAGKLRTREAHLIGHVGTIDHPDELAAFSEALKRNGRMTDDTRIAILRREMQIRATLGPASRP